MSDIAPFIHPDRVPPKIKPIKAMQHMRKLIADKEDTEQVFHIIQALNGNAVERNFRASLKRPDGRARYLERRSLPEFMDDHQGFGDLPRGSVGEAYIRFMKSEGLSAAGLVKESERFMQNYPVYEDDISWYGARQRDTHDLFHILTGYGRDAMGEASVLTFTYGQTPARGVMFIAVIAFLKMRKDYPASVKVKRVYDEARRHSKMAEIISDQDIPALMHENLDEARARMNIPPPTAYYEARETIANIPAHIRETLII